jgi:hypothetical protein
MNFNLNLITFCRRIEEEMLYKAVSGDHLLRCLSFPVNEHELNIPVKFHLYLPKGVENETVYDYDDHLVYKTEMTSAFFSNIKYLI